jgi:hypothetical protein
MKSPLVALAESGVPLLLVGGTAVQCYGSSRFTKDFDCIIAHDSDAALAQVLRHAGFVEFKRTEVVVRYCHAQRTTWVIDTLLCDATTFEQMWAQRQARRLGLQELSIAAPLHLIGMKLHAMRENPARGILDLLDCLEVIKHQRHTFSRDELAAMCDRYGEPAHNVKLLEAYDQ